ncbi:MAG: hypothetical protein ABR985_00605 [Methanotrichaceae archaeon]
MHRTHTNSGQLRIRLKASERTHGFELPARERITALCRTSIIVAQERRLCTKKVFSCAFIDGDATRKMFADSMQAASLLGVGGVRTFLPGKLPTPSLLEERGDQKQKVR